MATRTFTPAEANALLERVRPLVERLVEERATALATRVRRAELSAKVGGNGGGIDPHGVARIAAAADEAAAGVRAAVEELHALGVEVKDLDAGLVDFPALRDGERVYLCWQLGEDEVAWWHGLEEGFAGRRPLPL